jgi:hypothetical protein
MGSNYGCPALRVRLRACSGALVIGALSAGSVVAAPAPLTLPNLLHALAETETVLGAPLLIKTQGAALDFHARDVSGPAGRPIPLKIDLLGGTDTESGKLFIFSGLPAGVVLSPGGNVGDFWAVNAGVIKDLTLTAPQDFSGTFSLTITRARSETDGAKSATITVSIGLPDTKPTSAAAPAFPELTAAPPPKAAPPTMPSTGSRGAPANEQMLMARADGNFKKGDVSGARVIYEYLAMQGSALGAMAMGESYDPVVLSKMAVKGLAPDAVKARQWYEKAEQLGSGEARNRLNALASK